MRLPKAVIETIKHKNQISREINDPLLHHSHSETVRLQQKLEVLKLQIRTSIAEMKLSKRQRLRSKLLRSDPTKKKFWRFLKSQTRAAGIITALYKVKIKIYLSYSNFYL